MPLFIKLRGEFKLDNNRYLAELLFDKDIKDFEYYEEKYPNRKLKEGVRVTRLAPSPTGYLHLGVLYSALINRMAAGKDGIFYLRIEDTDKKREVEGGLEDIVNGLISFGIVPDEGFTPNGDQGIYGPYKQRLRREIYHSAARKLVLEGLAYPCFCTEEEIEEIRKEQESKKIRPGYYGEYACCRNLTLDEIKKKLDSGMPYVLRLKSPGNEENRVTFTDAIKGKIEMPENDTDIVLLKSDGIPTYHFAHAVDDHLMHTTHVIRGDEWISSVPIHLQLFRLLGFKPPKYAHIAPIMKSEDGSKRKLSKRRDPEAAVKYFSEQGFEPRAVLEYLLTIASSGFEDWRRANKDADIFDFDLKLNKMSQSGALFDMDKLLDVSKNYISHMSAADVLDSLLCWSEKYDSELYKRLNSDKKYAAAIFSIDRDIPKPRKDIAKWNEAAQFISYFYDDTFSPQYDLPENISAADAVEILERYAENTNLNGDKTLWFDGVKQLCVSLGYAENTKAYKAEPEKYKGHIGDVSAVIRTAVTGRKNSPDLFEIMRILGNDKTVLRLKAAAKYFKK